MPDILISQHNDLADLLFYAMLDVGAVASPGYVIAIAAQRLLWRLATFAVAIQNPAAV